MPEVETNERRTSAQKEPLLLPEEGLEHLAKDLRQEARPFRGEAVRRRARSSATVMGSSQRKYGTADGSSRSLDRAACSRFSATVPLRRGAPILPTVAQVRTVS